MQSPQEYRLARVKKADRIYVEFYAFDSKKGHLVRKRITSFEGKTEAEKLANAKITAEEINKLLVKGFVLGEGEEVPTNKPIFLLQAFKQACRIKQQQAGKDTLRAFRSFQNIFTEWATASKLENLPLENFEKSHVYLFLDWLKEVRKISNRTRNNYLDRVKEAVSVMIERGWLEKNPAEGIKKLKAPASKHVAFTPSQQEKLQNYLRSYHYGLYVFTRLIYHGFLRPVEITRIQLKHIDLENRVIMIRVHVAKNQKQQPVYITDGLLPDLKAFLEKYAEGIPDNYYLFSKGWKPGPTQYHRSRFSDAHRKALEACEMADGELTGYSWKHTGVCNAYRAGVDIIAIQNQCRHHSLEETMNYLRSLNLVIHRGLKGVSW